jgi:hypothetical protein
MRDAPDVIYVVSAYLSAHNARACGVHDYIAQLMFNCPPGVTEAADLAKMLAVLDLIAPLAGPDFRIWRQTRTGLLSYPLNQDIARGHLAASVYLQMALRPHIVHVVAHTEAHHAATAEDVIQACLLARAAVNNALHGQPDMTTDPAVQARREELGREARITLAAIGRLAAPDVADPLTDPETLARAVTTGVLDAPHLRNNPFARGQIVTRIDDRGGCVAVDPASGRALTEEQRMRELGL